MNFYVSEMVLGMRAVFPVKGDDTQDASIIPMVTKPETILNHTDHATIPPASTTPRLYLTHYLSLLV